jgi:hypothetical protein
VLYPSRFQFWRYFFAALWKFPARFRFFLSSCITAEHYYEYRRTIRRELESRMLEGALLEKKLEREKEDLLRINAVP